MYTAQYCQEKYLNLRPSYLKSLLILANNLQLILDVHESHLRKSIFFIISQMRFMDIDDELKVVGQNQQTLEVT